jgi:hypothetical protein
MIPRSLAEDRLTVAAAQQEDKALQVVVPVANAEGGVAGKLFQRRCEAAGIARNTLGAL